MHNAAVLTILLSPDGLVRSCSGALTRLLGHDSELVEGRPLEDLVSAGDRPALRGGAAPGGPGCHHREPGGRGRLHGPLRHGVPGPLRALVGQPARRSDRVGLRGLGGRRDRAPPAGAGAAIPGLPRLAHRSRAIGPSSRTGWNTPSSGATGPAAGYSVLPRCRQPQEHQRHAGPRGRGRRAQNQRGAAPRLPARLGHGGPHRRRRVRRPHRGHGAPRGVVVLAEQFLQPAGSRSRSGRPAVDHAEHRHHVRHARRHRRAAPAERRPGHVHGQEEREGPLRDHRRARPAQRGRVHVRANRWTRSVPDRSARPPANSASSSRPSPLRREHHCCAPTTRPPDPEYRLGRKG